MSTASQPLPMLPTTVVGSHARPAWYHLAAEAIRGDRFGTQDLQETLDHAVDIAILDQERLDIDVITDGEMRRLGGYIGLLWDGIDGMRAAPATSRRWGPPHYDMDPQHYVEGRVSAPRGLGLLQDYRYLRAHTARRTKLTCPGPLTFAAFCHLAPPYKDVWELAWDVAGLINAELRACVAEGADFIQLDDPSLGIVPGEGRTMVELVNRTFEGVNAKSALHICFGTNRGRPRGFNRTYRPLFPDLLDARVDQFVFEYTNRQMVDIDLWQEFQPKQEQVVGVVDQKAYTIETPEFVAERIRTALKYVPADKLWISPDCGFGGTPYWIAMGKLQAMVEGTAIVRRELAGH